MRRANLPRNIGNAVLCRFLVRPPRTFVALLPDDLLWHFPYSDVPKQDEICILVHHEIWERKSRIARCLYVASLTRDEKHGPTLAVRTLPRTILQKSGAQGSVHSNSSDEDATWCTPDLCDRSLVRRISGL